MRKVYIPNFIKRFGFRQFSSVLVNLAVFLLKKRPKKAKIQNRFFYSIFFCWEASTYQISENFINGLHFANFLHFWSILAGPWLKTAKKGQNPKKNNCSIFCCCEASTYQVSGNFIKRFGYCQFHLFLVNFGCFLVKNGQKKPKSKKSFFVAFFLLGSVSCLLKINNFMSIP